MADSPLTPRFVEMPSVIELEGIIPINQSYFAIEFHQHQQQLRYVGQAEYFELRLVVLAHPIARAHLEALREQLEFWKATLPIRDRGED